MDDAIELSSYLPISYGDSQKQDYMAFLWEAFETNYTYGKYQFAYFAYHMLLMAFIYVEIWQIRQYRRTDFEKAMIGFSRWESDIRKAKTPFDFSSMGESDAVRLLRLIGCDDSMIGTYRKLINDRNEVAHTNGNIRIPTQDMFDQKIAEMLKVVAQIQEQTRCVMEECYLEFLGQYSDPEDWQSDNPDDQVMEVLIHANYMSPLDVEACKGLDLGQYDALAESPGAIQLHEALNRVET